MRVSANDGVLNLAALMVACASTSSLTHPRLLSPANDRLAEPAEQTFASSEGWLPIRIE
jgi:hypothetical protein